MCCFKVRRKRVSLVLLLLLLLPWWDGWFLSPFTLLRSSVGFIIFFFAADGLRVFCGGGGGGRFPRGGEPGSSRRCWQLHRFVWRPRRKSLTDWWTRKSSERILHASAISQLMFQAKLCRLSYSSCCFLFWDFFFEIQNLMDGTKKSFDFFSKVCFVLIIKQGES